MARKSPLTDKQWEELGDRYLRGESARALGREFGVTEGAIRQRFSTQHKQIKAVANQVIEAEKAFKSLPLATQIATQSYIDDLRVVSGQLLSAAKLGSMTAHRLAGIANQQVDKLDEIDPLSERSLTTLKGIAALTRVANDATEIGVNLLRANKDAVEEANKRKNKAPAGLTHFYGEPADT